MEFEFFMCRKMKGSPSKLSTYNTMSNKSNHPLPTNLPWPIYITSLSINCFYHKPKNIALPRAKVEQASSKQRDVLASAISDLLLLQTKRLPCGALCCYIFWRRGVSQMHATHLFSAGMVVLGPRQSLKRQPPPIQSEVLETEMCCCTTVRPSLN